MVDPEGVGGSPAWPAPGDFRIVLALGSLYTCLPNASPEGEESAIVYG